MISKVIGAVVGGLRHAVEGVTALLFASFSVIIIVQVFYRYVLNDSIFWAEEFSRLAFFGVLMLSMPMVCDRKAHIVMDLLESLLKDRPRQILEWINAVLTLVFMALFGWYGAQLAAESQYMTTTATDISMAYVYALVPLAALLSAVFIIDNLCRSGDPKHE